MSSSRAKGLTFMHHTSYIYIGQTYRTPHSTLFIYLVNKYIIFFLDFLSPSSFIPPQNVVYFLILPFLVHKIFTFYINGALNCKCPAPGPKALGVLSATRRTAVSDGPQASDKSSRTSALLTTAR